MVLVFGLYKALRALTGNVQPTDIRSLWRMGLGREQDYSIAMTRAWNSMGGSAFYGTALFANGLQLLMTCCWYLSNSLFTSMMISHHWGKFITRYQSLRVSVPKGKQKSSYFLSLPYRYSVPLLICSTLIHSLLSQSVFVVQTRGVFYTGSELEFDRAPSLDASVVGFSGIGLILSLILVGILIIGLFCFGLRHFPTTERHRKPKNGADREVGIIRMPLTSTCSAAISASCHQKTRNGDLDMLPLRWGSVETGFWGFSGAVGHQEAPDRGEGRWSRIHLPKVFRDMLQ